MKLLLSGSTGFLGSRLVERLSATQDHDLVLALRDLSAGPDLDCARYGIGNINEKTDWLPALNGVDVVVHCAARNHLMKETACDPLEKFRRSNVAGSLRLAQQASQAGVRRIVFISSIKVNGESTRPGQPFTAVDLPAPEDPYAISKHEAEVALQRFAKTCDLEITIIRPPLVYGPGVKANFLGLLQLACSGYPLPFGSVHNRRSFIFLDNLVDLIEICLDHPEAANQVFLASDDDDISLTDLLTRIGRLRQIKLRLISCPTGLLYSLMTILGKRRLQKRLLGNLQVDISKTRSLLGWRPLESLESGLIKTLDNYSG